MDSQELMRALIAYSKQPDSDPSLGGLAFLEAAAWVLPHLGVEAKMQRRSTMKATSLFMLNVEGVLYSSDAACSWREGLIRCMAEGIGRIPPEGFTWENSPMGPVKDAAFFSRPNDPSFQKLVNDLKAKAQEILAAKDQEISLRSSTAPAPNMDRTPSRL